MDGEEKSELDGGGLLEITASCDQNGFWWN